MSRHVDLTGSDIHLAHRYSHATAAAREAESVVAADIGKISLQADDDSFWILADNSPVVWNRLAGEWAKGSIDASGTIAPSTVSTGISIPTGSYIISAFYIVGNTFTSATDAGEIQLGVNTDDASGILASIAISGVGDPFDAGAHDCINDFTAANFTTKSSGTRTIDAVITVETLTAGDLDLFVQYLSV